MDTLLTDLEKPIGEKLIDADNYSNEKYYDSLYFNCVEHWKIFVLIERINDGVIY